MKKDAMLKDDWDLPYFPELKPKAPTRRQTKVVTASVPPDLYEAIVAAAHRENVTISAVVRRLLRYGLATNRNNY